MESPSSTSSSIFEVIYEKIKEVPYGKVSSYGAIAKAIGRPRAAQVVGWALGGLDRPNEIPWQRIVNKEGRLSIVNRKVGPEDQKRLLTMEGVSVRESAEGYFVEGDVWHVFS